MEMYLIMVFITMPLCIGLAIFFVVKANKRMKALSEKLKNYNGNYKGNEYSFSYSPGSKNVPSSISLILKIPVNFNLEITAESKVDGFFKKIAFSKEIQVNDPDFDKMFYLNTMDGDIVLNYLDQKVREAIKSIYALGYNHISFGHTGNVSQIRISKSPANIKDINNEDVQNIISNLYTLADGLKNVKGMSKEISPEDTKIKTPVEVLFLLIPILLIVPGVIVLALFNDGWTPLNWMELILFTLKISISLSIFYIAFAVLKLKGRSDAHKTILPLLLLVPIMFTILTYTAVRNLNGYLDKSSDSINTIVVLDKDYKHSKDSGNTYYLITQSWRTNRKTEKIKINKDIYDTVKIGITKVTVITRQGKFNIARVKRIYKELCPTADQKDL